MSVQTEIDRISTAVQNAHLKVIAKGGTSAAPYLVANLPDAIDTIPIGEEVTAETSAYTELLTDLEVAVEDLPEATAPKLQAKTATPSETAQTVKPDSGYDGLSQVSVGAISKTYVGSGVTKQAAKTITPSTSSQTAVASGVYTTGAAIPSTYVKPSATKAATTYTPTTSNQTIAAGTYCSGVQTIKGDSNLVAGNIKSGVSIFGVAGSYEGSGGGGELQVATGSEWLTYNSSHSNGSTILEVTGLPFTPKHVCVSRSGNVSFTNSTNVLFMCEGGLYDLTMKVRSTTGMAIEVNKESVEIVMIENGFRVIAKTSNIISAGGAHAYYAIG